MNMTELKNSINNGAFDAAFTRLYGETAEPRERYLNAIDAFASTYPTAKGDIRLFSVPGRSEVCGNHTDHNHGRVLAAAVDLDVIAVVCARGDGVINVKSEGHNPDKVVLPAGDPVEEEANNSQALVRGVAAAFAQRGCKVGGFDAYTTSRVLKGSGISSSAAFEVLIGLIMSGLYNGGSVSAPELAMIGQFAENKYFGKPCGLMDQTACAVGGFVAIDFNDPSAPIIEPIPYDLDAAGYKLVIVNTGSSHSDLGDDYASVPAEMKAAAKYFGRDVLRGLEEADIIANLRGLREAVGDRAALRALHFIAEDKRAGKQKENLANGDVDAFLKTEIESGKSSAFLLQNIYTPKAPTEQALTLALAVSEKLLNGKGAWRVHGGGFAGTIQAFVPAAMAEDYRSALDAVFGDGAARVMRVRVDGAVEVK